MLSGSKLHTIHDDKLYYLKENEEEEEWALHIEAIKSSKVSVNLKLPVDLKRTGE